MTFVTTDMVVDLNIDFITGGVLLGDIHVGLSHGSCKVKQAGFRQSDQVIPRQYRGNLRQLPFIRCHKQFLGKQFWCPHRPIKFLIRSHSTYFLERLSVKVSSYSETP